jgi:hypothetical protein
MVLIILGFLLIVFGENGLNTAIMCPANGCPPDVVYHTYETPHAMVNFGIGLLIAGGIGITIGKKITN